MNPLHTYFPIFPAKRGEFTALRHLRTDVLKHVMPIFEIPVGDWKKTSKLDFIINKIRSLDEMIKNTHLSNIAIDTYYYSTNDQILENGQHIFEYTYSSLIQLNHSMIPIIGYDRWFNSRDMTYRTTLSNMDFKDAPYFIIRLDGEALDDSDDPDYFLEQIDELLNGLKISAQQSILLVDLKSIVKRSVPELLAKAERICKVLNSLEPLALIISGSSFPNTIDQAIEEPDSSGLLLRKESLIWQHLLKTINKCPIKYSDYGVKAPIGKEDIPVGDKANGKIRYTTDNHYYIARGHMIKIDHNFSQMRALAGNVINSIHFENDPLSWADNQIIKVSEGKIGTGGHETWVSIDTNRHIQHILQEVNHKIFV